jgi:ABC-type lipoprotein release transport system permease subunit
MADGIYYSARDHYSGDIIIAGFETGTKADNHIEADAIPLIRRKIEEAGIRPDREVLRTMQNRDSVIHYNGGAVPVKYVTGVDWQNEKDYLDSRSFAEGGGTDTFDERTMLVSVPIADYLGARTGDLVVLETETRTGQKNTAAFIVGGVIDDRSIFGYYKVFVSRTAINGIIGFDPEECSTIGLFFNDRSSVEGKRQRLQAALEGVLPIRPPVYNRDGFREAQDWNWDGVMLFLLTVSVYVSEVSQILGALNILSYFLYMMMLLIILVSAAVTYRLILRERLKEIGTMRALGVSGADVRKILSAEAFILATVSIIAGFALTLIVNQAISGLSFAWFPGFESFLRDGRLSAVYNPLATAFNIASVYVIMLIAVGVPSAQASRAPLPELLTGGVKE